MFIPIQYDNLPINLEVLNIDTFPWHIHKDLQLIYVLRGEVELKHVYTKYHLKKDDVHIIHRDDIHGLKGLTKDNQVIFVTFDVKYFAQYFPSLNYQIFSGRKSNDAEAYSSQSEIKSCILSMISVTHNKEGGFEKRLEQLACNLLDILYADFRSFTVNPNTKAFEANNSYEVTQIDRISRVLSYVYTNYSYKLSLSDIAEQENLSTYYLSHLFQQMMGDSFRNFVSMARVEMSEKELLSTNNSISLISQHMGFSNPKYYVENFKYWFGCHPKEHRLQSQDKIMGKAPVVVTKIPFEKLLSTLDISDEHSVFSGSPSSIKMTSFDLNKAEISFRSLTNKKNATKNQYENYDPHEECIETLKRYLKSSTYNLSTRPLYDTIGNTEGLMTVNGLKKPLFWLQKLIHSMYDGIAQSSDYHIITANGQNIQILFFNQGNSSQDFEFRLFNMPGHYQITEHRLPEKNCCTNFWKQLDYRLNLSDAEREQINCQSTPDISYKTVTSLGTFVYSPQLTSKEIVLTEIKKL